MTLNLFGHDSPRLDLPDAEVQYFESVDLGITHDDLLEQLIAEVPWEQRTITVWGKTYPQPRLIAWYGDPGCGYTYSGIQLSPLPWTELLTEVKLAVEKTVGSPFNSALLNLYRNHRDSMGFHSDNEPELGPNPIIASLSLGAERVFTLKHRSKTVPSTRLTLGSGTVLLMAGETQRYWVHGINKQTKPCGPRVNITFRRILT